MDSELVSLGRLGGLLDLANDYAMLGDQYMVARLSARRLAGRPRPRLLRDPFRIDGMAWLLCRRGTLEVEINLTPYVLTPGMWLMVHVNSIVQIRSYDEDIDSLALFTSLEFMRETNIDLNVLASTLAGRLVDTPPVLPLDSGEMRTVQRYYRMLRDNAAASGGEPLLTLSIARNLVAALCYQALSIYRRNAPEPDADGSTPRPTSYVHDFMELVRLHHRAERKVGFYASRLFITPKYLSLLVKNATGRSAADWIDQFVVLEAKSLLRFSGRSVSQIADDLNFPNQSTFGKYFKHLTGLSPTQYQKS